MVRLPGVPTKVQHLTANSNQDEHLRQASSMNTSAQAEMQEYHLKPRYGEGIELVDFEAQAGRAVAIQTSWEKEWLMTRSFHGLSSDHHI